MPMGDCPVAIDPAKADRRTQPQVDFLAGCFHSAEAVEAMAEGHVIACSDAQLANFVANKALERGEPLFKQGLDSAFAPAYFRGGAKSNCTSSAA